MEGSGPVRLPPDEFGLARAILPNEFGLARAIPPDALGTEHPLRLWIAAGTVARARAGWPLLGDLIAAPFTAKCDGAFRPAPYYCSLHRSLHIHIGSTS